MRFWLAVRGGGLELGILAQTQSTPPVLYSNQLRVRSQVVENAENCQGT